MQRCAPWPKTWCTILRFPVICNPINSNLVYEEGMLTVSGVLIRTGIAYVRMVMLQHQEPKEERVEWGCI